MPKYKITGINPHSGNQTTQLIRADNQVQAKATFEQLHGELKEYQIEVVDEATGNRMALRFFLLGQVVAALLAILSFLMVCASFLLTPMVFAGSLRFTNEVKELAPKYLEDAQISVIVAQAVIGIAGAFFWIAVYFLFDRTRILTKRYL